jgi:very-short-patch-repair endonuclease
MDFLLLFSARHRVVIEVDGKQHYAHGDRAEPNLYAEMVAEDRRLRLTGYEVYRFGGAELARPGVDTMLDEFFDQLAERMV